MRSSISTDRARRRVRRRYSALAAGAVVAVLTTGCTIPTDADRAGGEEPTTVTAETALPIEPDEHAEPDDAAESDPSGAQAAQDAFTAAFASLAATLPGPAGIAVAGTGPDGEPVVLTAGPLDAPVAWSTIKVPLAMAAVADDPGAMGEAEAAITVSDNPSAEALWNRLGTPDQAAARIEQVLADYGAGGATVPTQQLRAGFSIFGQTVWTPADQAAFAAAAVCTGAGGPVIEMMGRISADQSWGLGTAPGARFKGGWGPEPDGRYLARQFGVIDTAAGPVAVALAAIADSGDFGSATAMTTQITQWLLADPALLPGPAC